MIGFQPPGLYSPKSRPRMARSHSSHNACGGSGGIPRVEGCEVLDRQQRTISICQYVKSGKRRGQKPISPIVADRTAERVLAAAAPSRPADGQDAAVGAGDEEVVPDEGQAAGDEVLAFGELGGWRWLGRRWGRCCSRSIARPRHCFASRHRPNSPPHAALGNTLSSPARRSTAPLPHPRHLIPRPHPGPHPGGRTGQQPPRLPSPPPPATGPGTPSHTPPAPGRSSASPPSPHAWPPTASPAAHPVARRPSLTPPHAPPPSPPLPVPPAPAMRPRRRGKSAAPGRRTGPVPFRRTPRPR